MSQRVLVPSLVGVVVLGAAAVGGHAVASGTTQPAVENGDARYVAPSSRGAGEFSYSAEVSDDSGIREVRVIAWPAGSALDPTEAEMRYVDEAECRGASAGTVRCTYTLRVTRRDAAGLAEGAWYVSVLATAKDGGTTFVPRAATLDVTR
ncbi:DUF5707 domain-containing protein [Streptomyces sp. NPDC126497]|uniref:DUF5707 domain-containing protein n=1 Tax=Streptomyces sp. NPDC126497 TaxID=3155313 RepID=UPI003326ACA2